MASLPAGIEIRKYGEQDVQITTIPKGTLLFRAVSTIDRIREDIFGLRKGENHCLPPQYNVFFYPFPFADESIEDIANDYNDYGQ